MSPLPIPEAEASNTPLPFFSVNPLRGVVTSNLVIPGSIETFSLFTGKMRPFVAKQLNGTGNQIMSIGSPIVC